MLEDNYSCRSLNVIILTILTMCVIRDPQHKIQILLSLNTQSYAQAYNVYIEYNY